MIFVADIEDAALSAGNQAGDDHAFDEKMRQIGHDEAVLDGAGLAFIGVALDGAAGDQFGVSGGDIREDVIVDGNCRSMIAAAETGDVANLYIFWPRIGEAALEIGAQLASAVEMAAHVSADANLRFGR